MRMLFFSLAFASLAVLGCNSNNANAEGDASSNSRGNGNSSSSGAAGGASSSSGISIEVPNYPKLAKGASGVKEGWASRYWDACKPSCSWSDKWQAISGSRCRTCGKDGYAEVTANDETRSACDGGNSYTCFNQTPTKINETLALAFAATPGGDQSCGKCFQMQFDGGFKHGEPYSPHEALNGKTLIVMSSNIGHDVSGGQFDVMIPGGGVGAFDAFSSQINVSKESLGEQYGGLLSKCISANELGENWGNENKPVSEYQACLRNKCALFINADLKAGCEFYADWFMAANNPTLLYKEVDCPQYLIDKYKATMF